MIPVPVEIQLHIVPHLKAAILNKVGLLRPKAWWHFYLMHNMGFVKTGVYHIAKCSYRHSHALLVKILRMSYNAPTIKFSRFEEVKI